MTSDSRRHARYPTREGAFAALYPSDKDELIMLGRITDISEAGLGLFYIDVGDDLGESRRVSVFVLGEVNHVLRIPCRMVYDKQVEAPFSPTTIFNVKRCGLEFARISAEELAELRDYIQSQELDPPAVLQKPQAEGNSGQS